MTAERPAIRRFTSPFEVQAPVGADAWADMYPYYLLFSEEGRAWEESVLWYHDSMHWPEVVFPFDTLIVECIRVALGQYNSRIFAIPPSYGLEFRILNGYVYFTTVPVTGEAWIAERAAAFVRRAGHYYQHWTDIYAAWRTKMERLIRDLEGLGVPRLSRLEDEAAAMEARGYSQGYVLLNTYTTAIDNIFLAWQFHFELLNLGYVAYLNLFQFCKQAFPGIKEETIAQMVSGANLLLFRPDDELKELARRAHALGIAGVLREQRMPEEILATLRADAQGRQWVNALEAAKQPWFNFSSGTGLHHHHRSWIDDLTLPWSALVAYVDRLERGEDIDRPTEAILERRERLRDAYRELFHSPEEQAAFDRNVELARTVTTYVEDHNFYVEHWYHTIFWNKMREFGDRLVEGGFLESREDFFCLNRWEAAQALYELVATWATGAPAPGRAYWKREVAKRKQMLEVLRGWHAPPALGLAPPQINEPFTMMLYGISDEHVDLLFAADREERRHVLRGIPASPGVVTGTARVVLSAAQLAEVQQDEILVCASTAPSWGAVFGKIKATVSDIGGMMSHAAIVCREYGLPAVVGTGDATRLIQTGSQVRVDGLAGTVTLLE